MSNDDAASPRSVSAADALWDRSVAGGPTRRRLRRAVRPALIALTVLVGDHFLVNRWSYEAHDVRRGDIVVFRPPPNAFVDPGVKAIVNRVVALPGEAIEIRDCQVYIDDKRLEEPYTAGVCTEDGLAAEIDPDGDGIMQVPAGTYFMLGDNRCRACSADSRFYGSVDKALITGRVSGFWDWL
jgi:signal peptidase I